MLNLSGTANIGPAREHSRRASRGRSPSFHCNCKGACVGACWPSKSEVKCMCGAQQNSCVARASPRCVVAIDAKREVCTKGIGLESPEGSKFCQQNPKDWSRTPAALSTREERGGEGYKTHTPHGEHPKMHVWTAHTPSHGCVASP